jgi:signal transduction histidine kinase
MKEVSKMVEPCLDEVLGTLAHELRSPLATVLGGVNAIASESDLDPFARRALTVMDQQLRQAMRLVDDLFDLSAGSLRKLSVCKEWVTLADVVAESARTADSLLSARRHRLTVSLPPEPVYLHADPLRLTQVLTNLLGNAAKFTEPGGHVRLTATIEAGEVVVRVRDDGRGIDPHMLSRVFELFQQIPGSGARSTVGLGIGLALVKALVELHGGSVTAHSDGPGTGAEFVVRLPADASESYRLRHMIREHALAAAV